MPVRLTVVMVHSRYPSAAAERLAEAVVGELIGINGIDLTLVGPLSGLVESSTDRLTLGSISGDVAVLDWCDAAQTQAALTEIGVDGQRAAHGGDPQAGMPAAESRRMYLFDLNQFTRAEDVIAALTGLQTARQTKTFSIGGPAGNEAVSGKPRTPSVPRPPSVPPGASEPAATTSRPSQSHPTESRREIDLDGLLDELDQIDP